MGTVIAAHGPALGAPAQVQEVQFTADDRFEKHLGHFSSTTLGNFVNQIAFSADGKYLALGGDNSVQVLQMGGGQVFSQECSEFPKVNPDAPDEKDELPLNGGQLYCAAVAFAPDGKSLAVSILNRGVYIINTQTWTSTQSWAPQSKGTVALAWNPDGTLLAAGAGNGQIDLRAGDSAKIQRTLRDNSYSVKHLTFSPDGSVLTSVSARPAYKPVIAEVRRWKVADGLQTGFFVLDGFPSSQSALSRSGRFLAWQKAELAGGRRQIVLQDTISGETQLLNPRVIVAQLILAFASDEQSVAAATSFSGFGDKKSRAVAGIFTPLNGVADTTFYGERDRPREWKTAVERGASLGPMAISNTGLMAIVDWKYLLVWDTTDQIPEGTLTGARGISTK
jgi:dipeptidyl aminopeptidase/acylaminoacyl peptidase